MRILPLIFILPMLPGTRADEPTTFERDVRPVLAKRCAVCHDSKKLDKPDLSGGLALDGFEAVMKGTAEHHVVEPGKPEASELFSRLVAEDEDLRMPMGEPPLPEAQRELIRRWIEAGAPRGEIVAETSEAPKAARPVVRRLDVVLPVAKKSAKGAAVEVALKVGPLPAVTALSIRGDGRLLAVGTTGRVILWDLEDTRPAATLDGLPGPVHALAFTRDGRRLAVGSGLAARSGSVRVYSAPDGTLLHDFAGHEDVVYSLAFRPDGGALASAGFDQTARLWDLIEGKPAGVFTGHSDFVYDVAFAPDGRTLLSASKDRSIKRFDAATAKGLRTYSDHDNDVLALAVRPDGSHFVTAGNEPQLRWWAADGEKPVKRFGGHSGPVHQLAFSGDGSRLISAGGDKTVRTWDGQTGNPRSTLAGPTEWQYAVALSHDGRLAAAGGWDGIVRVWDADSGKLRLALIQPPAEGGHDWLAITPDAALSSSEGLKGLVRWRAGGAEVADPFTTEPKTD